MKNNKIKKYETVNEIINEFTNCRLDYYKIRKKHQIDSIFYKLILLKNQIKYIDEIIKETIQIKGKSYNFMVKLLESKNYYKNTKQEKPYSYILNMRFIDCSEENINKKKELIKKCKLLKACILYLELFIPVSNIKLKPYHFIPNKVPISKPNEELLLSTDI